MLPYALSIAAITILGFTVPLILSNNTPTVSVVSQKKETLKKNTLHLTNSNHDENTMILEPSMHFMQSIPSPSSIVASKAVVTAPLASPKNPVPPNATTSISPISSIPDERVIKSQPSPVTKSPQSVIKGKLTSIKRDDATFDIHEIEERFKENSNPNLGLYIAHYHYDHGNYSEAYNYALKTNSINSTMDESWLIFAKSLVKLGKEEQAKKTLQLYISNSNSQSAKNYLDTLNKDNSK